MEDITTLLETLKASPYEDVPIVAPHTGVVRFVAPPLGSNILGASGEWGEYPGASIAIITRENNEKLVYAPQSGELREVCSELNGAFVEAGTPLATVRHFLTKDEVIARLLRHALFIFKAPERAKYLFTPGVDAKITSSGCRTVTVRQGMELFIMSRMKRETPVYYVGPTGVIYDVYFKHDENVDAGGPLIGVCSEEQTPSVEDVILHVRTEWKTVS